MLAALPTLSPIRKHGEDYPILQMAKRRLKGRGTGPTSQCLSVEPLPVLQGYKNKQLS